MEQISNKPLFCLDQIVATPSALTTLEKARQTPLAFLARQFRGDW